MYQIAKKIDWEKFEKEFGKYYTEKMGRPGLRIRLLVGLHYLKHAYNVSDEKVFRKSVLATFQVPRF
ncbi:hypothetical protein LEP1GSC186_4838 [Leptospira noguchii serovar Autumnalis str. ZUN142]|uniref:Transposase InsH N-terminal domain-containing protein n=1 Tax=Leptospira noguchii serovar Autumnalis str. ZUN142 TaxID=1085540 RepID=M6UB19_9LEPT|nr:hypothetical protein LEP1GSC186_4838 [Leptospira noguchii serovar Autumnalis str. ZUN142]